MLACRVLAMKQSQHVGAQRHVLERGSGRTAYGSPTLSQLHGDWHEAIVEVPDWRYFRRPLNCQGAGPPAVPEILGQNEDFARSCDKSFPRGTRSSFVKPPTNHTRAQSSATRQRDAQPFGTSFRPRGLLEAKPPSVTEMGKIQTSLEGCSAGT
jgi:hypothetical protein